MTTRASCNGAIGVNWKLVTIPTVNGIYFNLTSAYRLRDTDEFCTRLAQFQQTSRLPGQYENREPIRIVQVSVPLPVFR